MGNDVQITTLENAMGMLAATGRPLRVHKASGLVQVQTRRGLTVNSVLRKDEWEELDTAVITAGRYPLRGVADLRGRGLTRALGGLGTMVSQWSMQSQMTAANVSMVGRAGELDRVDYKLAGVPIPVIFKDFAIDERSLEASRRLGDGLDTTQAGEASRVVAEKLESLLFNGDASLVVGGATLYGYTTHTGRITDTALNFGGGDFATSGNGQKVLGGMVSAANNAQFYGPFWAYLSNTQYNEVAQLFYADGSGQTELQRMLMMPGVAGISGIDSAILADGNTLLVQMTPDVVDWAEALATTVVEWMTGDGLVTNFKVMTVAAPRIKARYNGQAGVVMATGC